MDLVESADVIQVSANPLMSNQVNKVKTTLAGLTVKQLNTTSIQIQNRSILSQTNITGQVHKMQFAQSILDPIISIGKRQIQEQFEKWTNHDGRTMSTSDGPIFGPSHTTQTHFNSDIPPNMFVQDASVLFASTSTSAFQSENNVVNIKSSNTGRPVLNYQQYAIQPTDNNGNDRQSIPNTQQGSTARTKNSNNNCQGMGVNAITAIGHDGIHAPANVIDNNLGTRWSHFGSGSWIQLDLGEVKVVCSVDIAWYRGTSRQNNFVISGSSDGSTFRDVFIGKSTGRTLSYERYSFAEPIAPRYIRITIKGNTENNAADITEINVNGYGASTTVVATSSSPSTPPTSGSLQAFVNSKIANLPSSSLSIVNEPSVANKNNLVFYTGNWYAARSVDGGLHWTYIEPYADMNDFCCDQDVIYDPHHQIFIWYRQGTENANGENRFRLGVSTDALTWQFYNVSPTNFNSAWRHQSWDYPQIALGNKYLYICSNIFDVGGNFVRTVISRWSLNDLTNAVTNVSFNYYTDASVFNFTPVQGATDTMYWAAHVSDSRIRIYEWSETSPDNTGVRSFDRDIPAWTSDSHGPMSCIAPDGKDWCGRTDNRILDGWISHGTVGFIWMAAKGNGFPWPYLNAAEFTVNDMMYLGRPYLWSQESGWMYGFVAPNGNQDVGIVAFAGGGNLYPSTEVGINTNTASGLQTPWEMKMVLNGTKSPSSNKWGDFLRVRPFGGSSLAWSASGYAFQGESIGNFVEPHYIIFGRKVR